MNKKGEGELLPEETLKIIIAVICIAGLIVLIAVIYFSVTGDQNMKKAKEVLSRFANETKRINAGEVNKVTFLFPNPKGWHVFSFVGQDIKPNSCAGKSCLCICEIAVFVANQPKKCDDKGVCVTVINLKKFNPIEIKSGGTFVSISKINGLIEIIK